ncbi:MAG: hypothetical protein WCG25_08260 [bacterium]
MGNWAVRLHVQLHHAGMVLLVLSHKMYCQNVHVSFSLKHVLYCILSFVLLASTDQSLYVILIFSLLYILIVNQVCTHHDNSKFIISTSFHQYKNFESEYHTIVLSDLLIFVIQKKLTIVAISINNNLFFFITKIRLKSFHM